MWRPTRPTRALSRLVYRSSKIWSVCLKDRACLVDRRDRQVPEKGKKLFCFGRVRGDENIVAAILLANASSLSLSEEIFSYSAREVSEEPDAEAAAFVVGS